MRVPNLRASGSLRLLEMVLAGIHLQRLLLGETRRVRWITGLAPQRNAVYDDRDPQGGTSSPYLSEAEGSEIDAVEAVGLAAGPRREEIVTDEIADSYQRRTVAGQVQIEFAES